MLQQLITILIIGIAAFIVGRNIYRSFFKSSKSDDPCNGCGSSCGGCPVMDLKDQIAEQHSNQDK